MSRGMMYNYCKGEFVHIDIVNIFKVLQEIHELIMSTAKGIIAKDKNWRDVGRSNLFDQGALRDSQ